MDTTTFPRLPAELWYEILSYVTKRDLKNLRLAGKWQLADTASAMLFDTSYVAARKGVLDAFLGLASHPILRHCVKHLIFDSSWVDPHIEGDFVDDWSTAVEGIHQDKQLAIVFAMQEHIQLCELRPSLEKALVAFSSLRSIKYADLARNAGLPGDTLESWSKLMPEEHPRRDCVFLRQFSNKVALCCMNKDCKERHSDFLRRQYGGLLVLLDLIHTHHHPTSLQELSLGNDVQSAGVDPSGIPDFFLYQNSSSFPQFKSILVHLRKLELSICFPSTAYVSDFGHRLPASAFDDGLRELLSAAEVLEVLLLSGEMIPGIYGLNLDRCWPDEGVGSLRVLQLRACRASFSRLSNIAQYNKYTLHHLELDNFELLTNGWPTVVDFCEKHAPNLDVVYGYTWFQGKVCVIDKTVCDYENAKNNDFYRIKHDHEQDDDQDSSFSDGEYFHHTSQVVGRRRKVKIAGAPKSDESEYEDEVTVTKTMIESSDESLDFDSDDDASGMSLG